MGSKKPRRRTKTREDSPTTPVEVTASIRADLLHGKPRQALDRLKAARGNRVEVPHAAVLRHCAYTLRAQQLAQQQLHKEAAAMSALAQQSEPARAALTELPPEILGVWLRIAALPAAIAAVAESGSEAQRALVDRLMIEGFDPNVAPLLEKFPWATHWQAMRAAWQAMATGDWAAAAQVLSAAPRHSLLGPWRWFCKSMHCFVEEDKEGLAQCLAFAPAEFALKGVVPALQAAAADQADSHNAAAPSQGLLAAPAAAGPHVVTSLMACLQRHNSRELAREIAAAADNTTLPVAAARQSILELLALNARNTPSLLKRLQEAVPPLLPAPLAGAVQAKLALLSMRFIGHDTPWQRITAYWNTLSLEFPTPHLQRLAQAQLLRWVANQVSDCLVCWEHDGARALEALRPLFKGAFPRHHGVVDNAFVPLALLSASLHEDPADKECAGLALHLLESSNLRPTDSNEVLLRRLVDGLPNEAEPLLQLGRLYRRKNAYRKAEQAIAAAQLRDPASARVRDEYAASLVMAAWKSGGRKQHARALEDLALAASCARPNVSEAYEVARLACTVLADASHVQQALAVLDSLPLWQRARVLAVAGHVKLPRSAHGAIKSYRDTVHRRLCASATASDVQNLLAPAPEVIADLFTPLPMGALLAGLAEQLLVRIDSTSLLDTYDALLAGRRYDLVLKDARVRLSDYNYAQLHLELRFYTQVVPALHGDADLDRLAKFVVEATEPQRLRLQEAANRLAVFAHGDLVAALKRLDFSSLVYDDGTDDLEGDDDMDAELIAGVLSAMQKSSPSRLLECLEEILDLGPRDEPRHTLVELGKTIPPLRAVLEVLLPHRAKVFAKASPEARVLLATFQSSAEERRI